MKIIALDTTLACCAVAAVDGARVLAHFAEPMERGHAERLAPMADEVMRAAGVRFSELDRIAVTTGPGSFTGLRVGLSFARGLRVALGIPCIGVSTLEALALERGTEGLRGAVIAIANEFCAALYKGGAPRFGPRRCSGEEAVAALRGAIIRGPAAAQFGGEGAASPDAAALALRAAQLAPALYAPDPLYLRAPHVALPAP